MNTSDSLLSFVTDESGGIVSIHLDKDGAEILIRELTELRDQMLEDDCPHTHLFPKDMDGELTGTKLHDPSSERNIVYHVKIYGWNQEWAKKHGLKP